MADFHRVIRSLVYLTFGILIGGGITFEAYADTVPATFTWSSLQVPTPSATPEANCQAYISANPQSVFVAVLDGGTGLKYCQYKFTYDPNNFYSHAISRNVVCPSGSTWNGTACNFPTNCPAGTVRRPDGSCGPDCTQNPDERLGQNVFYTGSISTTSLCDGTCSYSIGGSVNVCLNEGKCYGSYGSKTGSSCTASNLASGNTPEFDCLKQGKSYGTVNGTVVCMTQGSPGSQNVTTKPPASTSTNSAGGNTTTTSSTTTYTVNNNGTVTTTTTTTTIVNGGTPQVATEQETKPKENFCNENPELKICKEGTFSGACGSYQCDGDAATCALAKKVHQDRCDDLQESAQSTLGGQIFSGNDPEAGNNPASQSNRDTIDLGGTINEGQEFGGGCPQDRFVNVLGQVITIPFSSMCSTLEILGSIVLAFSFVVAGRIVGAY